MWAPLSPWSIPHRIFSLPHWATDCWRPVYLIGVSHSRPWPCSSFCMVFCICLVFCLSYWPTVERRSDGQQSREAGQANPFPGNPRCPPQSQSKSQSPKSSKPNSWRHCPSQMSRRTRHLAWRSNRWHQKQASKCVWATAINWASGNLLKVQASLIKAKGNKSRIFARKLTAIWELNLLCQAPPALFLTNR